MDPPYPLISFSEGERKWSSSSSSNNAHLPVAYPLPSQDDIRRDDGDPTHGKNLCHSLTMTVHNFIRKKDLNIGLEDV